MRNTQGKTLPIISLLFLLFAFLLNAETPTQTRARQWARQRNLMARTPAGYIALPLFQSRIPAFDPQNVGEAVAYDEQRLLAGHVLRRIGFGPNDAEMSAVLSMAIPEYINQQLNPDAIDDSDAISKLPPPPDELDESDYQWINRWHTRMVYSKRQLQEKMTVIWHEHFAVSNSKVGLGRLMHDYEDFLRENSLGNFRDLLIGITKDQAMLIFLDNNSNNGNANDANGKKIPPNENYAREFLQLFSLGTEKLNIDGTPIRDRKGVPVPTYTEKDVKEVARALTGWTISRRGQKASFLTGLHDSGKKKILGVTLNGRSGADGANEVNDVVNIVMRQPTTAPFISKILIQKMATETPTPGYVARVARIFRQTGGNIRSTVRAILTDSEFYSASVIRTQYKEPIEHFVGALRALGATTKGESLIYWSNAAAQLMYYPPSVFSFYPPGNKGLLVNTALVTIRDRVADDIVAGNSETYFNVRDFLQNRSTPEQVTDRILDSLLAAPADPFLRSKVISHFKGRVDDQKVRGAIWLVLCSPDFQRN